MKLKASRIERVRENMARAGLEQILVSSIESVYYLTGLWINPGERMLALHLSKDGVRLYVNHMFAVSGLVSDLPLAEFDDGDDPVALLAGGLRPGKLGVDKNWPGRFVIGLMDRARGTELCLGSAPVDDARMIKDEEELQKMRLSSRLNDRVTGSLPQSLAAGDTEFQVARRYADRAVEGGAGGDSFSPLICFGKNCAEPHHATDRTELKLGDSVILDVGLMLDHYMSDMTRTVFFGGATDEEKKVYDIVLKANMAAKAAVRPGVPMKDIDRAARKLIEDAGYGPHFLHRTGHGIGLEVHEPADASSVSRAVATPGMTFSIEPGIYLPGKFGVRIEDLVAVTEDGCEVLNSLGREFTIV